MLVETLKRFFILQTFIVSAVISSTENIELTLEVDTNEEHKLIENNSNQEDVSDKQLNEEIIVNNTNQKDDNVEPLDENDDSVKEPTNDINVVKIGHVQKPKNDGRVQLISQETHEDMKKFKEKKPPLWQIKGFKDRRQEPGFDLTLEEMNKFKIWKNGVVPYYIDVVSFSDKVLRDKIRNYLHMVNFATSLNFVELPNPPTDDDERWVFFINRRGLLGCADHTVNNFTNQGVQKVVLGYDCIATKGEIAEAVMSIVGVPAQHNAPDRDKYIKVNFENIMPDKMYLFEKIRDDEWLFHDLDYDYQSISHYDTFKYSTNGRATIQLDEVEDLNPAKEFSPNDYLKINMLYNYITMKANLKSSKCDKLFKPRNKFERFVPSTQINKPRKKPSRYLGIQSDNEKNNKKEEEHNNEKNKKDETNTDGEKVLSEEQPGLDAENIQNKDEGKSVEKDSSNNSRNKRHTADEEILNSDRDEGKNDHKENKSTNSDERDKEDKKGTNKEINNRESQNHRQELNAKQKLIGKKNALSLLSDYYSDF